MGRRLRLERKLEKRQDWAGKARARSAQRFAAAAKIADQIPLGQPILAGHHSERHARRDAERIQGNLSKGVEEGKLAEHHRGEGRRPRAPARDERVLRRRRRVEQLEAQITERTAQLERRKAINKQIRKGAGWESRIEPPLTDAEKAELASLARVWAGVYKPGFPPYALTN